MTQLQAVFDYEPSPAADNIWRRPAPAISGPGWAIPDQSLSPFKPADHDRSVRAAAEAIEHGLGDRVAWWLYRRAHSQVPEWEAAFDFHLFRMRLRRGRR